MMAIDGWLKWKEKLVKRYCNVSDNYYIPLERYYDVFKIERNHLKPGQRPGELRLDWTTSTETEQERYQQFVIGIINRAFARRTDMMKHLDLESERAIFTALQVYDQRGKMTDTLYGWASPFDWGPQDHLIEREICGATLGIDGVACWNSETRGESRYEPLASLTQSKEIGKIFLDRMKSHEEKYLSYSMEALADCPLFKMADSSYQRDMVQVLRDVHAKRLIELITSRKSIPECWAEEATSDWPERDKFCKLYNIRKGSLKRAPRDVWAPMSSAKDSHLANKDLSSSKWYKPKVNPSSTCTKFSKIDHPVPRLAGKSSETDMPQDLATGRFEPSSKVVAGHTSTGGVVQSRWEGNSFRAPRPPPMQSDQPWRMISPQRLAAWKTDVAVRPSKSPPTTHVPEEEVQTPKDLMHPSRREWQSRRRQSIEPHPHRSEDIPGARPRRERGMPGNRRRRSKTSKHQMERGDELEEGEVSKSTSESDIRDYYGRASAKPEYQISETLSSAMGHKEVGWRAGDVQISQHRSTTYDDLDQVRQAWTQQGVGQHNSMHPARKAMLEGEDQKMLDY